jgi:hypothetical protein
LDSTPPLYKLKKERKIYKFGEKWVMKIFTKYYKAINEAQWIGSKCGTYGVDKKCMHICRRKTRREEAACETSGCMGG